MGVNQTRYQHLRNKVHTKGALAPGLCTFFILFLRYSTIKSLFSNCSFVIIKLR